MSRKQKKRNKPYRGEDAAPTQPNIHRYQAVVRSPMAEWWFEHKRAVKIGSYIGGGALVAIYLVYELLRLIFNW